MLRETRFVQIYRRLELRRGPLGVVAGQVLKHERGAVADHPCFLYLESLATPKDRAARVLDGLIGTLDVTNVQLRSEPMLRAIEQSGHAAGRALWALALKHVDNTAPDLAELVRSTVGREQSDNALALLEVSPHSDYARAVLIEKDWERARPHLAEWQQAADRSPVLLAALARKYSERGQVEDARRLVLRYIRFSPDQWAYELLAAGFKDAGDLERWQATLDEYLAKTKDNERSRAFGARPGRRVVHGAGRLGQGLAVCPGRGRHGHLSGPRLRCALRRGAEGLGRGRGLQPADHRKQSRRRLGGLVSLLQADGAWERRGRRGLRRSRPCDARRRAPA